MNLKCSPYILWLQDAEQILLTHTEDQCSWVLREEKAFVWGMLCQHHKTDLLLEMFARIYPDHDTQGFFNELVLEWHSVGILISEENGRD